jgi:hypothetical protein
LVDRTVQTTLGFQIIIGIYLVFFLPIAWIGACLILEFLNRDNLFRQLERDYNEVKNEGVIDIQKALLDGLKMDIQHTWIDYALDWIEQGCEINDEIAARLEEISKIVNFPQDTRHRASKIYDKWQQG